MIQIISAILLFVSCTLFGNLAARRALARSQVLKDMISDMQKIYSRMEYSKAPVAKLFATRGLKLSVWERLSADVADNTSLSAAWEGQKQLKQAEIRELKSDEMAILDEFMGFLGESGLKSQLRRVEDTVHQLETVQKTVSVECVKRSKLLKTLGMLLGLCLFVIAL